MVNPFILLVFLPSFLPSPSFLHLPSFTFLPFFLRLPSFFFFLGQLQSSFLLPSLPSPPSPPVRLQNVPVVHIAMSASLALVAAGRSTGCVVECGETVSCVVPFYHGHVVPHAIARLGLAGVTGSKGNPAVAQLAARAAPYEQDRKGKEGDAGWWLGLRTGESKAACI